MSKWYSEKATASVPYMTSERVVLDPAAWEKDEDGNWRGRRHPSHFGVDGICLLPMWPHSGHFRDWNYRPFVVDGELVDLYFDFTNQPRDVDGVLDYEGDLAMGIQLSEEGGDYISVSIDGTKLLGIY